MFLTFFRAVFSGKVMRENHIRKVLKSEKRKVKNIRKHLKLIDYWIGCVDRLIDDCDLGDRIGIQLLY